MSDLLERIMQGLHIAIMADVGMTLTNADAKVLLDELTALAASNTRLRRVLDNKNFEIAMLKKWADEDRHD